MPVVKIENVKKAIAEVFKIKKAQIIDNNLKALQKGYEYIMAKVK
jgi:Pyruvate/2-oxoacid:ferredoxin oxidoreductase gamma subunit